MREDTANATSLRGDTASAETSGDTPAGWLAALCRELDETVAGVAVGPREGALRPLATWPEGSLVPQALADAIGAAVRSGTRELLAGGEGKKAVDVIACPLGGSGGQPLIVGVALMRGEPRRLPGIAERIEKFVSTRTRGSNAPERVTPAAALLEFVALALEHQKSSAATIALATALAKTLRCTRVAFGFDQRGRTRVETLSDNARFDPRSNVLRDIGAAMDEALDIGATLVHPAKKDARAFPNHAQRALCERHSVSAVCSVPLPAGDRHIGVVTLERGEAFRPEELEFVERLAVLLGPVLELMLDNSRTPLRRMHDWTRSALRRVTGPRRPLTRAALAVLALGLAALAFVPGTHRVSANAQVEGLVQRAVVAPVDGFIGSSHARAGDRVEAGQVLATLDTRELEAERRRLEGAHNQHLREYRSALAGHERARAAVLRAQADQAAAQLELLEAHLERSRLVAPIDGMIVAGDLTQSLGSPVTRGEPLFEIAPLDGFRIALNVDEREIAYVETGQDARLVLTALPAQSFDLRIERITPVSSADDGSNVFRVEASLSETPAVLRPGMKGVARIEIGPRSQLWLWTHGLSERLRLLVWRLHP